MKKFIFILLTLLINSAVKTDNIISFQHYKTKQDKMPEIFYLEIPGDPKEQTFDNLTKLLNKKLNINKQFVFYSHAGRSQSNDRFACHIDSNEILQALIHHSIDCLNCNLHGNGTCFIALEISEEEQKRQEEYADVDKLIVDNNQSCVIQ